MKSTIKRLICICLAVLAMGILFACEVTVDLPSEKELPKQETPVDKTPSSETSGEESYNAVFYDRATAFLQEEFVKRYYPSADKGYKDEYWGAMDFSTHTYLITTQGQFDEAFTTFPDEIDFDKEIVALYFFVDIQNAYSCVLKNIEVGDELVITIEHKTGHFGADDTSAPIVRCLAVKMDKVEVEDLNVILTYEK